jgi:hypothetical protein
MSSKVPPWVRHRRDDPQREHYAAMTPDERLACFVEACELAHVLLASRPDRTEVLRARQEMPARAEARWLELVREARRERPNWQPA